MECLADRHAGLVHAAPPNHGTEPISLRPNVIYDYHETFEGAEEPSPNDEIARGGESLRASSRLHGLHALVVAVVCLRAVCASSHGLFALAQTRSTCGRGGQTSSDQRTKAQRGCEERSANRSATSR